MSTLFLWKKLEKKYVEFLDYFHLSQEPVIIIDIV